MMKHTIHLPGYNPATIALTLAQMSLERATWAELDNDLNDWIDEEECL